jgi:RNA polymerase sigma-70 factor (ECF subfamily)
MDQNQQSAAASGNSFTELLHRIRGGEREALDAAIPLVYGELKKVAANHLRKEPLGAGRLETTALVHETFLKIAGVNKPSYQSRAHFFAIASRMMRQILVDHARARQANKRKNIPVQLTLAEGEKGMALPVRSDILLDLDEALLRLAVTDPRKVQLIEMRYFGGMTAEESAEALHITAHAVRHDLRLAHAWLHRDLAASKQRQ